MMPNLPPNWSLVKLGDIVKGTQGVQIPKSKQLTELKKNFNRYLYISDFKNDNNLKYVEDIYPSKNVTEKDLIMVNTGATAGQVLTGKAGVLSNNLFKITYPENLLREYLLWFLRSPLFYDKVSVELKGAANEHMGHEKFYNYPIPLPPLPEQKKIVEKIEELFSGLDSGVASLKKAKEQIRLYRQSVLSAAFSGKLTQSAEHQAHSKLLAAEPKVDYSNQLPEGWKWVKLGEVVKIVSGNTPKGLKSISNAGSLPFYKVSDMNSEGNERIMFKANLYLTTEEMTKLKIKIYPKHTTIFPKRGGAILTNKKRLLATDASFDLNLMGLVPSTSVNHQFLHYWVIKLDLSTIYDGSNVPQINNKNVEPLDFPLPPLNKQTQIVEEIEKRFSEADNLEKPIDDSLAKSETLRHSILKQAFEGRLV